MNLRDQLLRRARKVNNESSWKQYKLQRNKCTKRVRKAKATYHQQSLNENRSSPRKFWRNIKSIYPSKISNKTQRFKNPENRANSFADYFSNIVGKMKTAAFPLTNFVWRYNSKKSLRTNKTFHFSYISTSFVERELRKLKRNKATGTDLLPPNLLKDCSKVIAPPLAHILNMSINTNSVPNMWKSAKITPLFKSGNHESVENFRPISVLPVLSKILEKAVHEQFYNYLESNMLLSDSQFGFRKKRST